MAKWVRPTLHTKYHIDFDWWEEQNLDFRTYLSAQLCTSCKEQYGEQTSELIDWVDPTTAEVKRVDGLWQALKSCCSNQPDYINEQTPLTTAIFRIFLANDNRPLSPLELSEKLPHVHPDIILRTLSKGPVYRGIKPAPNE